MQILETLHNYKWYLIAILALLTVLLCYWIYVKFVVKPPQVTLSEQVLGLSDTNINKEQACNLSVEIAGAVKNPNVYCFPEGSLVIDGLKRAGGFVKGKNASEYIRSNINLARPLVANEKVYFPYRYELKYTPMKYDLIPIVSKDDVLPEEGSCVSLNEATLDQLDILNGVGPSTAQKIIDGRPYKVKEDLKNVSGVGDALFEKIKDKICL